MHSCSINEMAVTITAGITSASGFDSSEVLHARDVECAEASLRFADGQKRGLACRLATLDCKKKLRVSYVEDFSVPVSKKTSEI